MKNIVAFILSVFIVLCCYRVDSRKELLKADVDSIQLAEDTMHLIPNYDLLPSVKVMKRFEDFPDSIIAVFTRNGIVEDSVIAYRQGYLKDSAGNFYSPAYIFRAAVGDAWLYDVEGNFFYFYCTPKPHSGKEERYNP